MSQTANAKTSESDVSDFEANPDSQTEALGKKIAVIRLSILGGLLVALLVAGFIVGPDRIRETLFLPLRENWWGPIAFIALYAVLTVLMAPGLVSTISGGALFGFWGGLVLSTIGATLGASLAFMVARATGRERMQALLGDKTSAMDGWIKNNGFSAVLILRLVVILPFNVVNYAAGLTQLKLSQYTVGTAVGIIPGVAAYTLIGSSEADVTGPKFILSLLALALLVLVSTVAGKRIQKNQSSDSEEAIA